jgi:hypothetical protein
MTEGEMPLGDALNWTAYLWKRECTERFSAVICGNLPAFRGGFKAGSRSVQPAFFLGMSATDWTLKTAREVSFGHTCLYGIFYRKDDQN